MPPADDDWDVPTDVTTQTWIVAAEDSSRHERATLAAIERDQLRELAAPQPLAPPPALARERPAK